VNIEMSLISIAHNLQKRDKMKRRNGENNRRVPIELAIFRKFLAYGL